MPLNWGIRNVEDVDAKREDDDKVAVCDALIWLSIAAFFKSVRDILEHDFPAA